MTVLPTVTIQTPSGPVRINESDYDPKVHKLAQSSQPAPEAAVPVSNTPPTASAAPEPARVADEAGDEDVPLTKQHRGAGRWYVMRGEDVVSGPYDKDAIDEAIEREQAG